MIHLAKLHHNKEFMEMVPSKKRSAAWSESGCDFIWFRFDVQKNNMCCDSCDFVPDSMLQWWYKKLHHNKEFTEMVPSKKTPTKRNAARFELHHPQQDTSCRRTVGTNAQSQQRPGKTLLRPLHKPSGGHFPCFSNLVSAVPEMSHHLTTWQPEGGRVVSKFVTKFE